MSSSTASNCALCHNQRRALRDEISKEKVSITPLGSPLPVGNRLDQSGINFPEIFHVDDGC
jgi:hypothetical protein